MAALSYRGFYVQTLLQNQAWYQAVRTSEEVCSELLVQSSYIGLSPLHGRGVITSAVRLVGVQGRAKQVSLNERYDFLCSKCFKTLSQTKKLTTAADTHFFLQYHNCVLRQRRTKQQQFLKLK
jgi:hypothetical protein